MVMILLGCAKFHKDVKTTFLTSINIRLSFLIFLQIAFLASTMAFGMSRGRNSNLQTAGILTDAMPFFKTNFPMMSLKTNSHHTAPLLDETQLVGGRVSMGSSCLAETLADTVWAGVESHGELDNRVSGM